MTATAGNLQQSDDRDLLRQFVADKSPVAFEELVRRNTNLVFNPNYSLPPARDGPSCGLIAFAKNS
jgi:hypothetical protein